MKGNTYQRLLLPNEECDMDFKVSTLMIYKTLNKFVIYAFISQMLLLLFILQSASFTLGIVLLTLDKLPAIQFIPKEEEINSARNLPFFFFLGYEQNKGLSLTIV